MSATDAQRADGEKGTLFTRGLVWLVMTVMIHHFGDASPRGRSLDADTAVPLCSRLEGTVLWPDDVCVCVG